MAFTDANNYVVGKGAVHFQQYFAGEQNPTNTYLYLGNTPTFSVARTSTTLDHYSSDFGLKVKDESVDLTSDMTVTFSTDNINVANNALWFGGTSSIVTQTATGGTAIVENVNLFPGCTWQLGTTLGRPGGYLDIDPTTVVVTTGGGTPVAMDPKKYNVDGPNGVVHVFFTSAVAGMQATPAPATVTYKLLAATNSNIIGLANSVYGALYFQETTPVGTGQNYTLPYVKLSATGSLDLKGDTWQTLSFSGEVLQSSSTNLARVYINGNAV